MDDGKPIYHYHDRHPTCFNTPGLSLASVDSLHLPKDIEEAIMREIWMHGSITAVMTIYHDQLSLHSELQHIMNFGVIYMRHSSDSQIHGQHAVLVVGWGVENGIKYWKCANSWGESRIVISVGPWSLEDWGYTEKRKRVYYPETGYFRILRGQNFCGIESQLCCASALKDLPGNHSLDATALKSMQRSGAIAGGWHELEIDPRHVGVNAAVAHYKAQMQHATTRRKDHLQLHRHNLTRVRHQVVAGSNYKIALTAEHETTGELYEMEGIVHCDMSGQHSMKHLGTPRKRIEAAIQAMETPTATPPEVQGGGAESETSKASTAAAGSQALPQGNAEASDRVHVPKWALWLIGAAFTMMVVVIIGLLYILSTKRRRTTSGVAVELDDKVANPRTRAPSLEAIDVMDQGPAAAQIQGAPGDKGNVVSSPRTPTKSTGVRARSVSQEGVICLD